MSAKIRLAPGLTIRLHPLNGEAIDDLTSEVAIKDRHLSRVISLEYGRTIAISIFIESDFNLRTAAGAMILVDILSNTPTSRGAKNRQAYWICKAAAEGLHEIKWFKLWKTKDFDPWNWVLGRRLVMPDCQPIRVTRSTTLRSADGSTVSHYSIRVSVTLGKLQDGSHYIDNNLPEVSDDEASILRSLKAAGPPRLDTEPAKPEQYSFNSELQVIRPEWFKSLSGKAGTPFTIDFINTGPTSSGRRQSNRIKSLPTKTYNLHHVLPFLADDSSDDSEEGSEDDEEQLFPIKKSPKLQAASSVRKSLNATRQTLDGGVSRGRNPKQQRTRRTAQEEDAEAVQPLISNHRSSRLHREGSASGVDSDTAPVRKRQRRSREFESASNAGSRHRAPRSQINKPSQAPTPPLETTSNRRSIVSTRSTTASEQVLRDQPNLQGPPAIKLEPPSLPTRPIYQPRTQQAKTDEENEEYALLKAKTRAALMKAEAAEMEAQLAQATLERGKRKRRVGTIDLTED